MNVLQPLEFESLCQTANGVDLPKKVGALAAGTSSLPCTLSAALHTGMRHGDGGQDTHKKEHVINAEERRAAELTTSEGLANVFGKKAEGPAKTRQEAYARCPHEVVTLAKCLDSAGPVWFLSCSEPFIALQKCCAIHQGNKLGMSNVFSDIRAAAAGAVEETQSWFSSSRSR